MFYFNKNEYKKYIIVIFVIIMLSSVLKSGIQSIISIIEYLPGLFIALTVHEYAHALTAYKLGDVTPLKQGRISLNPLAHIDIYGLISLLVLKIGWGKPVEYNPNVFKSVQEREKAEVKIAVAGPIANFILSIILAIIIVILELTLQQKAITGIIGIVNQLLMNTLILSVGLGVFNLIPVPPLDGYKVFYPILKKTGYTKIVEQNEFFVKIIFLVLILTDIIQMIITPLVIWLARLFILMPYSIISLF